MFQKVHYYFIKIPVKLLRDYKGGKGGHGQMGGRGADGNKGQDAQLSKLNECKKKTNYKKFLNKKDSIVSKISYEKKYWIQLGECRKRFNFEVSNPQRIHHADLSSSVSLKKTMVEFTLSGENGIDVFTFINI